jgi:hypothetical protein
MWGSTWRVAVDHDGFDKFVATNGGASRIATYWGVDQGDAATLRSIVDKEFSGPLDLVIDDASHLYAPTKASFETLFPLLRPGGLYIIEDWAWAHWPAAQSPTHRSPSAPIGAERAVGACRALSGPAAHHPPPREQDVSLAGGEVPTQAPSPAGRKWLAKPMCRAGRKNCSTQA